MIRVQGLNDRREEVNRQLEARRNRPKPLELQCALDQIPRHPPRLFANEPGSGGIVPVVPPYFDDTEEWLMMERDGKAYVDVRYLQRYWPELFRPIDYNDRYNIGSKVMYFHFIKQFKRKHQHFNREGTIQHPKGIPSERM
jgi:hypothetical protein